MISLTGTAQDIGRVWGETNAADIATHLQEFLDLAREKGVGEEQLIERSRSYNDIVAEIAPHWHAEGDAVASAAGVDEALYRALLAGKYRELLFSEDCTSFAAVKSATADGRTLFHKNRDLKLRPQAFYRKQIMVEGDDLLPYLAVGDTSDTGVMMMVNGAGLAGSADTGPQDPDPYRKGLMNPYILRYIAERATTCDEALGILRMVNDRGWYAGGERATVWVFAERHGKAMRVEHYHKQITHSQTVDGVVQSCEREGLREFLADRAGSLTWRDMNEASRLPGVRQKTNCSSFTAVIDRDRPELWTYAWAALGKAEQAPYCPLYVGAEHNPKDYINGTLFAYSLRGPSAESIAEFEDECEGRRQAAEAKAREAIASGDVAAARRHLETASSYAAGQADAATAPAS